MIKDRESKVARVYHGICPSCGKPILAGQAYTKSPIRNSRTERYLLHQGDCELKACGPVGLRQEVKGE